ncbi:hypothetical protein MKW92_033712 [Papaver armeniacum]|nr:hypothetical protein MKW92_033712 [Papaver armeniacum]
MTVVPSWQSLSALSVATAGRCLSFQIFHHSTAKYFEDLRASIFIGLNAVYGNYTRSFCCRALGFQNCCRSAASMVGNLVNELSGTGIGAKVTTAQYASDVISLKFYRARYLQWFQS